MNKGLSSFWSDTLNRSRRRTWLSLVLTLLAAACGGGGGGDGGGGGGNGDDDVLYVRATVGDDGNSGSSANAALRTIQAAVDKVASGSKVIVGPGLYGGAATDVVVNLDGLRGTAAAPIEIVADSTGTQTGDAAGAVVVDAGGRPFGFRFSNAHFVVLDGFTITGSAGSDAAGMQIRRDSRNITIRNCEVTSNAFDGVRIETSSDVLLFNNLIHTNLQRGIQLGGGSVAARLINNTVALNGNDGISGGGSGSRANVLRNNLVFQNSERGIDVRESATDGYDADYNLVFQRAGIAVAYGPQTPKGLHDVNLDPLVTSGFRLSQTASGQSANSPAVDVGDPATDAQLGDTLRARTTKTNRDPDSGAIDVGYHYPGRLDPPPTRTLPPVSVTSGPGTPTPTPPVNLFVRAAVGSDSNTGRSPTNALKTIQAAVNRAAPGVEIVVGPGTYAEAVSFRAPGGNSRNPITLRADPKGTRTGDAPGPVLIDGTQLRSSSAILIDAAPFVIVDGFRVTNTSAPALQIRSESTGAEIRNCEIFNNDEDGIRVQDSDDVVLLNNLIYCNLRRGVLIGGAVIGSNGSQLINNTIAQNGDRGLFIGNSDVASRNTFVRNNIIQNNGVAEIQVVTQPSSSLLGFDADYNMVFDTTAGNGQYAGPTPGPNDLLTAARFVESAACEPFEVHAADYRLAQASAGETPQSAAVDAGDPDTPAGFAGLLEQRTTATSGALDTQPLDLGYHFDP